MAATRGIWHDDETNVTGPISCAKEGVAEAAQPMFQPVARTHHATIAHQEQADEVPSVTGYPDQG